MPAGLPARAGRPPPEHPTSPRFAHGLLHPCARTDDSDFESSEFGSGSEEEDGGSYAAGSGSEDEGSRDPAARTAWEVGLNGGGLAEEEAGLLPPGASETDYVRVRNALLCLWRADVSRVLTQGAALAAVEPADRPYALAAHRFLSALGYINFGVAPALHHHLAEAPQGAGSVVVVGAGCAGLAAARQLRAAGHAVVVVEGRQRPGGRVWTERLEVRGWSGVGAAAPLRRGWLQGLGTCRRSSAPPHSRALVCKVSGLQWPTHSAPGRRAARGRWRTPAAASSRA